MYPGVLAVGATDEKGQHADISVTGRGIVLSAPGVNIHSTSLGGRYQVATGTSDATAIVSGAVALIRSRFPDLPAAEVVHRLTATATDKGAPGWDEQYGYGVLNLVAALTADVPASSAPSVTTPTAVPPESDSDSRALPIALAVLVAIGAGVAVIAWRGRARRRRGEPVA
jgi:subtilisin family serine protease